MINRNSLTHYTMIAKLIRASREAVKQGYATVYNRKGSPVCTMRCHSRVISVFRGNMDITALVSSVLFD